MTELYAELVAASRTVEALRAGKSTEWKGQPLTADDLAGIEQALQTAEQRARVTEDAAAWWTVKSSYGAALPRLKVWFSLFVGGVLLFALVPSFDPSTAPEDSRIEAPIPATVYVVDPARAGLPTTCPTNLKGQIVAGPLDRPTVVTPEQTECPAQRLEAQDGAVVVVPDLENRPSR